MSEMIPPPPDVPPSAPPPVPTGPQLGKVALSAIGAALFVGSTLLCYFSPLFFALGGIAAIISLFFSGYRLIFVGYIGTLGLFLLGAIIFCFVYPPKFD